MNVQSMAMDPNAAAVALIEYKEHRSRYDARDWEIERIYRQIALGKKVISVRDAICNAGLGPDGRPVLAIGQANQQSVMCHIYSNEVLFHHGWGAYPNWGKIALPGASSLTRNGEALTPRIPPQHRPPANVLHRYHILWEADWKSIPRDPYLLRRIGRADAWVVLAAWDLTDVEMAVLRR